MTVPMFRLVRPLNLGRMSAQQPMPQAAESLWRIGNRFSTGQFAPDDLRVAGGVGLGE